MPVTEFLLGKKEQISISDAEGTYGTAATRVISLGRNAAWDPNKDTENITELLSTGANTLDVPARDFGVENWGGVLTFVPQDWRFLKFVLLSASNQVTDTNSGGYYTHTFTNTSTGLLSFSLERAIRASTSRVRTYEGCQVNSFSLAWDASGVGNFLTASADIVAEDCNNGTSVTSLTAPTTEGFKPRHVTLTLENSAVAKLVSGTLSINNKLSPGRYADTTIARLKAESIPELRKFHLSAIVQTSDDTFFDMLDSADVLAGTNTIVFQRGTNDNLTVTFTNAYLDRAPDPTNFNGINTASLEIDIDSAAFVAKDARSDYVTFT